MLGVKSVTKATTELMRAEIAHVRGDFGHVRIRTGIFSSLHTPHYVNHAVKM